MSGAVYATPIRPDVRKIVGQPQQDSIVGFMAARAGWNGPEMPASAARDSSDALGGAAAARADRAELISAATPDIRAVLGIVGIIFLLRMLKAREQKKPIVIQNAAGPEKMAA